MGKFKGKNGTPIDMITKYIKAGMEKWNTNTESPRKIKNSSYKYGSLTTQDWKRISLGLEVLTRMMKDAFDQKENEMALGDKDISRTEKDLVGYRYIIEEFVRRITIGARTEQDIRERMDVLKDYSQIAQAARDGIITKEATREERKDGTTTIITYETSMTPSEVINAFRDYKIQCARLEAQKLDSYLGLGLGLAGMLGTLIKGKGTESSTKKTGNLLGLGTTAITGLKLIQGILLTDEEREKQWGLREQQGRMMDDLFGNEAISSNAEKDVREKIMDLSEKEKRSSNKSANKDLLFNVTINLAIAIISGAYINKNVQIKENGKIDGKSLAFALASLEASKGIAGKFIRYVPEIQNVKEMEKEFKGICDKVQDILSQMEEKVYPLKGTTNPFDSLEIANLNGQFYPKKNYETGEKEFSTTIKIPEFSMKRGDIVLLSGESGAGKSTFLRLLKRGDINNRECITLSNGEKVDNLGNEYISFRPSINLGDENNVLFQITGKTSISDLDENEKENLTKILRELNLDSPNLLEQLASKKFMEFSTGQQRRLALSKLFYRIDDGTSVIIVDEPVGNVEDKLIREQLEMIRKYAKDKDVMLLLTTHRLDLAEDLATKRYHINKDGVLEQIPLKQKEEKEVNIDDMRKNYVTVTASERQAGNSKMEQTNRPIEPISEQTIE